jgi:hypothetical protein
MENNAMDEEPNPGAGKNGYIDCVSRMDRFPCFDLLILQPLI